MKIIWFDDYVFYACVDQARVFADNFDGSWYAKRGQVNLKRIKQQVYESKLTEILLTMGGNYDLEPNGLSQLRASKKSHDYDIVSMETKKGFHVKQSSDMGEISYIFEKSAFSHYRIQGNFMLCTLELGKHTLYAHPISWSEIEPLLKDPVAKLKTKKALYERDLPKSVSVSWIKKEAGDADIQKVISFPDPIGDTIGRALRRRRVDVHLRSTG